MVKFEGYERRIDKINECLKEYGIPQKHFMKYHCLLFCIFSIKKSILLFLPFPYIHTGFFNLKLTLGGAPHSRFGMILKRERKNN